MKKYTFMLLLSLLLGSFLSPVYAEDIQEKKLLFLPLLVNNYDSSIEWQDVSNVELGTYPLNDPLIVIDDQGRPHLVSDSFSSSAGAFIYHTYLQDNQWVQSSRIANTLGDSKLLYAPVNGLNDDLHIVWKNQLNFGGPYRLMYAKWNGSVWEQEMEVLRNDQYQMNGMVKVSPQGTAHFLLVYSNYLTSTWLYKMIDDSTTITKEIPRLQYVQRGWPDYEGGVHFIGDDYSSGGIYSHWMNDGFIKKEVPVGSSFDYRGGILDKENNFHLIKSESVPIPGGNVWGLTHQCFTSLQQWGGKETLSAESEVSTYAYSQSDNGNLMLAWTDKTKNEIHITLWNGCQQIKSTIKNIETLPDIYDWNDLVSVAWNEESGKACLLAKKLYFGDNFGLLCVGINN